MKPRFRFYLSYVDNEDDDVDLESEDMRHIDSLISMI